jgi:hypothetical protein
MNQLTQYRANQDRRAIADWLTLIDYASQQSDFISRRQEGTGRWLLDSNEFQYWLKNSVQTLFCPGIPGAGKTIITAIIIEYLWKRFCGDTNTGIIFLYCNFRREYEQKPADLLSSLLKQLVQEQSPVPKTVRTLYKRYKDKRTRPSLDEISKVLHSVVAGYSRIFILIDALDEYQGFDRSRKKFLAEIFDLQAKTRANLFITSRFIPEILNEFGGKSIWLEIRARNKDMERYIDGHISMLLSCVLRSYDLQLRIKTEIIEAVDGMCVSFSGRLNKLRQLIFL